MDTRRAQTVVIGAGPGGYVAAIRAAQLGRRVTVIEGEHLGGVCLNVGCIPSKALIHAASLFDEVQHAEVMGITAQGIAIDTARMIEWKGSIVKRLTGGVATLLKANKVEVVAGTAVFRSAHALEVTAEGGAEILEFEDCVIATGSRPIELPGFAIDGEYVLGSTEALSSSRVPQRVVVLGGGYIGLEIGTFWRKLGSDVTVVELLPTILPGIEADCARVVARNLKKRKVKVLTETRALSLERRGTGAVVTVEGKKGRQEIECDAVLATVGRRPRSDELGLAAAGVELDDHGFVAVDRQQRTNVGGVFAIGDIAGQPMLAHKASHEGLVAAAVIAGQDVSRKYEHVPAVVFTDPEIASVGLTEEQAREQGADVVVGKFPFSASGRALTLQQADGFSKVVAERGTGRVLGAHVVGPQASEIIAEMGLAVELEATLEDIAHTVHAHPTLPETLMEAAEVALGRGIHVL